MNIIKIVILDGDVVNPGDLTFDLFKKYGDVVIYPRVERQDVLKCIGNSEIVITNKCVIDKNIIENCNNIKYIGLLSTGYNVIDLECAKKHNIVVTNVPNYSTDSVAQFTFSLILHFYSSIADYSRRVKEGYWSKSKDFCMYGNSIFELKNKTIGILGFGNIAKKVSEIAKVFDMDTLVCSRTKRLEYETDRLRFVDIDYLFKNSDIVSIHCPLSNETRNLVDKDKLSLMKKSSIIINTARGPIINEDDLIDVLKEKRILGAGLDVVSHEPINIDNPLLYLDNCVITPHVAWLPMETRRRLIDIAVNNLESYLNGNIKNRII